MKLLVFAHVPPPHHGQSYMVQLMVEGLGRYGIEVVHVDARVSDGMEDVGTVRSGKLVALLGFCWQAIRARFVTGATAFYYIPAPGKRSALYRDWVVMTLCRPFFRQRIFHWHATGLAEWLEREGKSYERALTRWLLGRPELSMVLAEAGRGDADWLRSKEVTLVPNGIPDPCPDFAERVLPQRRERLADRRRRLESGERGGEPFRLLFLAHCSRGKGLFDAVEGVALYNESGPAIPAHLKVAGRFMEESEREAFDALIRERRLEGSVEWVGFVGAEEKSRLLEEADALCFPTYHYAESFGLVVVEAMACGALPLVTRWRAIPELLPEGYPGFVAERSPQEIAAMISQMLTLDLAERLRSEVEAKYTLERHLERLAEVIQGAR